MRTAHLPGAPALPVVHGDADLARVIRMSRRAVGSRRFIDGGMRSAANADLASGCEPVVILAPQARGGGPTPGPRSQANVLRAHGARVVLVTSDAASVAATGPNVLDPSRRAPSAHAGQKQPGLVAAKVSATWSA